MNKKGKIVYQLALRTFTPDGTLAAATKLLGHIASLGVDIVYICPFYVQENDENRDTWSVRQLASNTNNPKNPYKIADYFHVDEEYGTNEDLKEFVKEAHRQGLLVMFDLVYLHCGKQAVFVDEHPDFVERNEDGTVRVPDRWPFARLNFSSKELRDYLISNMTTWVAEYDVDAFRCDVGDSVPLDFWNEAFDICKKIKPELITLNEGIVPEYIEEVFDFGYSFTYPEVMRKVFAFGSPATELKAHYDGEIAEYGSNVNKIMRTIDNHDKASDWGVNRNEIVMTSRGVEAALVVINTYEGFPLLWNGYEVCDDAENNMFSNRFFGKRSAINWSKAFTADGVRRMQFIKDLYKLYHEHTALKTGSMKWLSNSAPEEVISYVRTSEDERILVVVNSKNKSIDVKVGVPVEENAVYMSYGAEAKGDTISLEAYGYIVARLS